MSYPKWLYHASLAPKVVQTAEEHQAQGVEWCESPGEAAAVPKNDAPKDSDQDPVEDAPESDVPAEEAVKKPRSRKGKGA